MTENELRDLDKTVAEIMGYDVSDGVYYRGEPHQVDRLREISRALQIKPKDRPTWFYADCPHYSTDMRAAIELMEQMKDLNPFLGFSSHHTRTWEYTWFPPKQNMQCVTAEIPSLAVVRGWMIWKNG